MSKQIRVIAPSQSMVYKNDHKYARGEAVLRTLGYDVSFGEHVYDVERFGTASAEQRAADFNAAYADPSVDVVLAAHGGWSANDILALIDWGVVRANPKPLIGFSDNTALVNAIWTKTGIVCYLGPTFSTLSKAVCSDYTLASFQEALTHEQPIALKHSAQWTDHSKKLFKTKPWKVLNPGTAEGVLVGGNVGTFYLLQGTEYQPTFDQPFIFALEDDDEAGKYSARELVRKFESQLQLPGFRDNLQGLIIGRFQPTSRVTVPDITAILDAKKLGDIPIIMGVDFGHTLPLLTLPIGGKVQITTTPHASITLL